MHPRKERFSATQLALWYKVTQSICETTHPPFGIPQRVFVTSGIINFVAPLWSGRGCSLGGSGRFVSFAVRRSRNIRTCFRAMPRTLRTLGTSGTLSVSIDWIGRSKYNVRSHWSGLLRLPNETDSSAVRAVRITRLSAFEMELCVSTIGFHSFNLPSWTSMKGTEGTTLTYPVMVCSTSSPFKADSPSVE